ncbi:MAG: phosphoadenylyl-sulfate reductase [Alphaproteobacteria bacterium]|nr:phosphoadenylyl-sulfate reductase [Alphaproteobacteria bacterium]
MADGARTSWFATSTANDVAAAPETDEASAHAETLLARYRDYDGLMIVRAMIEREFPGRIALVSSFGAEAAVLLDLVARIEPATPVLFLETGKHFAESLAYRHALAEHIGLTNVRDIRPDPSDLAAHDPDGTLNTRDPDACCAIRKVWPLETALDSYDAWFTGRKRFQTATRGALPAVEAADGRIKVNPLARWGAEDVARYHEARGLPRHPLHEQGYLSIGCEPCTRPVAPGEDPRAGRWAARDKTECGIHSQVPAG